MLGKLVDEAAQKDAIHVAIMPVEAAEKLAPGQDVGLLPDGRAGAVKEPIGIVDPYLKALVFPGQRFYLCLYPGTVTSIRHDWTHPAIEDQPDDEESREFIERIADECGVDYETMLDIGRDYVVRGDWHLDNSETYKAVAYEDWPKFWRHFEAVTGLKVSEDDKDAVPFSCSC